MYLCTDGESTSSDPCSDIYRGVAPFSEPEVAALVEFVTTLEKEGASFLAYLTLHAYGKVSENSQIFVTSIFSPEAEDHGDIATP